MAINVKTVVEISVEMTLNQAEFNQLVFFLRNAKVMSAPKPPLPGHAPGEWAGEPLTDIVNRLTLALTDKGPR